MMHLIHAQLVPALADRAKAVILRLIVKEKRPARQKEMILVAYEEGAISMTVAEHLIRLYGLEAA